MHPANSIVDPSEETREVLQTVLRRRGMKTLATGRIEQGRNLARQHQPDLIVLDLELEDARHGLPGETSGLASSAPNATCDFPENRQYRPHYVLLGKLRGFRDPLPSGEIVAKPYHYGPLVRRIEELLASEQTGEYGPCRRCSSSAEPIRAAASN
jgi:hypothetical protein